MMRKVSAKWIFTEYFQYLKSMRCFLPQIRTLRGHTNEKNFVGLTVNNEYIACGSESNEVVVYHKVICWLYLHFSCLDCSIFGQNIHQFINLLFFEHTCTSFCALNLLSFIIRFHDSETVFFAFWQAIPRPAACHGFGSQNPEGSDDDGSHFISAVCWKSEGPTMLAANSQGTVKVLVLAPWIPEFVLCDWLFALSFHCPMHKFCGF